MAISNDLHPLMTIVRKAMEVMQVVTRLTRCRRGHPAFTVETVYDDEGELHFLPTINFHSRPDGKRECRICRVGRQKKFRARRRAAQLGKAKAGGAGEAVGR